MFAWMNRASLEKTIATGKTHFWSRSRQKFWMKGEESGHTQSFVAAFLRRFKPRPFKTGIDRNIACKTTPRTMILIELTQKRPEGDSV